MSKRTKPAQSRREALAAQKTAQAYAKAEKKTARAYAKANRPWFKKKRVLVPMLGIAATGIAVVVNGKK